MSPFGLVAKEKYVELRNENEKLRKSLNDALDNLKELKSNMSRLSESLEALSQKNIGLTNAFHTVTRERDQLRAKLGKYVEERQLLQRMIQELDSLARKRRKKLGESSSDIDSFESDIQRLLNQTPVER